MAILEKIRENFNNRTGFALGAALLGALAMPADANAADGKVSYRDIRNETSEVVEISGPMASGHNRIALKVNGGTNELNKAIYLAAQQIEIKTDRDVFFLHSKDDDLNDGKTKIEIYISGRRTGVLTVYDASLINEQLVAVVNDGIKRMDIRDTAAINTPIPDQS